MKEAPVKQGCEELKFEEEIDARCFSNTQGGLHEHGRMSGSLVEAVWGVTT